MSRVWITDLWVKDAEVTLPDGTTTKISPTSQQLRALKKLPEHFRTKRFMRGNRWRVAWHEHTPNGPRQRTRSYATKDQAEAFIAELEDDIRSGRYLDPADQQRMFGDVAEAWLESKRHIKDSTWHRYRRELDTHVLPKWETVTLGKIRRSDIEQWVSNLQEGSAPTRFIRSMSARPLRAASLSHTVRIVFGGVLKYAIESRYIALNPLQGVQMPRDHDEQVNDLHVLTFAQVEELATEVLRIARTDKRTNRADNLPRCDATLVRFLATCGLRINEALALKVEDVDFKTRRVTVRRTWTKTKTGARKLGVPKTWQKRVVPLPDFLTIELQALTDDASPGEWLFRSEKGDAVDHKNWYNRVWRPALMNLGYLPEMKLTIHDLRHTAASAAIGAGADVKLVQQMLGHKDATETLNTYSHLWPDRLDEVMSVLDVMRAQAA